MIDVVKRSAFDRRDLSISDVIEEFGAWKVLVVVLKEIFRFKWSRNVVEPSGMTTHLRRDVGMPPDPGDPQYWDLG